MSEKFFYQDAYAKSCKARVVQVDDFGIQLDRTVFYPVGGGQPGDTGVLRSASVEVEITNTIFEKSSGNYLHVPKANSPLLDVGDEVTAELDWNKRYAHMRMHSALHLLCAVIDGGVTGGSIGKEKSRLDFNLPDTKLDKEKVTAELNKLIVEDHPISASWLKKEELDNNIDLVRTMSVRPPMDSSRIRLIEIKGVDLQACGGTHVKSTREIGKLRVGKIESKGKHNRRINLHFTS
jgi:misacylated tRNA(Ala) deacylase